MPDSEIEKQREEETRENSLGTAVETAGVLHMAPIVPACIACVPTTGYTPQLRCG